MDVLNKVFLPSAEYLGGKVKTYDLTVFLMGQYGLVFNPETGVSLLADKKFCDNLIHNTPSKNQLFKLVQRGMAKYSNRNVTVCDTICELRPNFFLIDLTKECNLNCRYCIRKEYFEDHNDNTIEMARLMDICRYIEKHIKKEKIAAFTIQAWGGEPLLELQKIIEIRKFFDRKGLHPAMRFVTNGTLLDEKTISTLEHYDLEFSISIDGDKEINDRQRINHNGAGSYDSIVKGIKAVQKFSKFPVSTVTTITGESIKEVEHILEHLVVELGVSYCKFNFVNISKEDKLHIETSEIAAYFEKIINKIINLNKQGYHITEANVRQRVLNLLERNNDSICLSSGCKGGYRLVSFDFHGNIYPCELIGVEEVKLGNINFNDSLNSLISDAGTGNPYFAEKTDNKCKECLWRYYCRGGCTSAISVQKANNCKIDVENCMINKILYPLLIKIILNDPKQAEILTGKRIFV